MCPKNIFSVVMYYHWVASQLIITLPFIFFALPSHTFDVTHHDKIWSHMSLLYCMLHNFGLSKCPSCQKTCHMQLKRLQHKILGHMSTQSKFQLSRASVSKIYIYIYIYISELTQFTSNPWVYYNFVSYGQRSTLIRQTTWNGRKDTCLYCVKVGENEGD